MKSGEIFQEHGFHFKQNNIGDLVVFSDLVFKVINLSTHSIYNIVGGVTELVLSLFLYLLLSESLKLFKFVSFDQFELLYGDDQVVVLPANILFKPGVSVLDF